jgi:hypothetical protein
MCAFYVNLKGNGQVSHPYKQNILIVSTNFQGWDPVSTTRKEIHINTYLKTFSHYGTDQQGAQRDQGFYLRGHFNSPVRPASIENEGTLQQRKFDACQTIRKRPETSEV